jgi:hypothetical protein
MTIENECNIHPHIESLEGQQHAASNASSITVSTPNTSTGTQMSQWGKNL